MLSVNSHEDDIWCIDPRGHLTLSVSKDTYELQRLEFVGDNTAEAGWIFIGPGETKANFGRLG